MAWPAQLQPLSPGAPHGSPRRLLSRRKSVILLATACLLAAVLIYEGIAFSRRLEEQRVAEVLHPLHISLATLWFTDMSC